MRIQDFRIAKSLNCDDINFIKFSASLFGRFLKIVNPVDVDMGYQIIDFMIEAIQGPCRENQEEFFQNKVAEFIKEFLNDVFNQRQMLNHQFQEVPDKLPKLIKNIIKLLNA